MTPILPRPPVAPAAAVVPDGAAVARRPVIRRLAVFVGAPCLAAPAGAAR